MDLLHVNDRRGEYPASYYADTAVPHDRFGVLKIVPLGAKLAPRRRNRVEHRTLAAGQVVVESEQVRPQVAGRLEVAAGLLELVLRAVASSDADENTLGEPSAAARSRA